ncbi:hypothetical protein J31TS4_39130 [Paenibacillus sp. J31TS4]|uniref:spore protease YyaC n=1 Tax=Paenibacillus sp. J31TS4 TaxID=2807195 RepID=UPI001AFE6543|nr:spore protease YyaC [Paenibacillus sp. J31TS4]GIP40633.1 hypothetical protein J31TS4_39130 [Paenibacillus sp. J31TS4]
MKFTFRPETSLPPEPLIVSYTAPEPEAALSGQLAHYFHRVPAHRPIVIVCIGTDRSTGDSLGPLVGSKLQPTLPPSAYLYGTLQEPVHALNLAETLAGIQEKHTDAFVVGIDACLGQLSSVGAIKVAPGPLKPGAGVNKELPPVGDIHVTGIVNVGGFMEYFVLQNTRLFLVMTMAEIIAQSLLLSLQSVKRNAGLTAPSAQRPIG